MSGVVIGMKRIIRVQSLIILRDLPLGKTMCFVVEVGVRMRDTAVSRIGMAINRDTATMIVVFVLSANLDINRT